MKTGFAFGDHIRSEKLSKRRFREEKGRSFRHYIFLAFLGISSLVLVFKLFSLQIVNGSYYRALSDSNRIRQQIIHAPRGIIFDRNGEPLVFNVPGFRKIEKEKAAPVSRDEALKLIAKGERNLAVASLREYPHKDVLTHILGYVGQINDAEIKDPEFASYTIHDHIGKDGIERTYERLLAGTDGRQLIEVDAMGKPMRVLGQTDPVAGTDISLTVDLPLQKAAYEAMKDVKKGAVVVSTPQGEILALVSKPSFDPNLFTQDATYVASTSGYTKIADILTDGDNQPLLNRAIGGVYPPGSTFKIITAAAGLQKGIFDEKYSVEDKGIIRIGEFSFSNWYFTQYGRTDGNVNVVKALSRSNDIFFYKAAEKIQVDRLSDMAHDFGVGQILGIDLKGEAAGVLPTRKWKEEEIGEAWYLGDTFIYGIGQGYLLTTPLQVNAWTEAIANGGTLYQPKLLKDAQYKKLKNNFLSEKTIKTVTEGMIQACSKDGTAYPLFDFKVRNPDLVIDGKNFMKVDAATGSAKIEELRKVSVACKTGTAQHGDEDTKPHAWITLFAPAQDPQVVVTVLAESAGEGSAVAGPIAKKILEEWFGE